MIRLTAIVLILFGSTCSDLKAVVLLQTAPVEWCAERDDSPSFGSVRAQISEEDLRLRVAAKQPGDASLFRVTSGFFADSSRLGIANAGNGEVLVFDLSNGRALRVGSPGPGPGEFTMLYFAHWNAAARTIVAFDAGAMAVKEFTLNGVLRKSMRLQRPALFPLYDVAPLPNGGYVAVTSWSFGLGQTRDSRGVRQADVHVLLMDSVGNIETSVARLPGRSRAVLGEGAGLSVFDLPFSSDPWVMVTPNGCLITPGRESAAIDFRSLHRPGVYTLEVPGMALAVSRDEWHERTAGISDHGHDLSSLERPEKKPAWARAVHDGATRLWLEEFHHRDEPSPAWWVVNISTNHATRVPAPPGALQILAADRDRIAVLHSDKLGVEMVVIYEIVVDP